MFNEFKDEINNVLSFYEAANFAITHEETGKVFSVQVSPKHKFPFLLKESNVICLPAKSLDWDDKFAWFVLFHELGHYENKLFITQSQITRALALVIVNRVEREEVLSDKFAQSFLKFTEEELTSYLYDIYIMCGVSKSKSQKLAAGRARQCFE